MRKISIFVLLFSLVSASAFAHAGEVHTYLGTVTMLRGSSAFVMKTTAGKSVAVSTTKSTVFLHADGHAAKSTELAMGRRVVVTMSKDGRTATRVKLGAIAR